VSHVGEETEQTPQPGRHVGAAEEIDELTDLQVVRAGDRTEGGVQGELQAVADEGDGGDPELGAAAAASAALASQPVSNYAVMASLAVRRHRLLARNTQYWRKIQKMQGTK
jgi:hypothetical protein